MVKKKAASSSSKPTATPSNTPQVPSDEQSKKSTARELLQRAFDGLSAFRNLTSRLVLSTEERIVVENIETFIITQKQEADKPIGFSSVKMQMLEDLNISTGSLDFDMERLQSIASGRQVSERFNSDREYLQSGGLSHKEQLASIATVNFLFESMYNTPQSKLLHAAKFSPELTIPEGLHKNPVTGIEYTFHGAADYVTWLVNKITRVDATQVKDLVAVKGYSGRNLAVIEVKSPLTAFSDQHFAEAMAQAITASHHTEGDQRFIMTDSKRWKFCVYQQKSRKCYISSILDANDDGAEIVVTALDEWIWFADNIDSPQGLWKLGINTENA